MVKVMVCGAYGKMGREVLKAVHNDTELSLVGAVDLMSEGADAGDLIGVGKLRNHSRKQFGRLQLVKPIQLL